MVICGTREGRGDHGCIVLKLLDPSCLVQESGLAPAGTPMALKLTADRQEMKKGRLKSRCFLPLIQLLNGMHCQSYGQKIVKTRIIGSVVSPLVPSLIWNLKHRS